MKSIILFISLLFLSLPSAGAQDLDTYLATKGLVDVRKEDPSIKVCLKYATPDNFLGYVVYEGITGIWLHPDAAGKLVQAQKLLKEKHPEYTLLVYDATRPMSVQAKMWDLVKGTNKTNYVSNPANGGGLHNYGMAVDLTIADARGKPLPMGSEFDYFGEEAHINQEEQLLKSGKITSDELYNRHLLREVMTQAGFRTILYEWWHFNACSRAEARQHYPLVR